MILKKKKKEKKKTIFIQAISHKFERRRADFFQDYPNVMLLSVSIPRGEGSGIGWGF